MISLVSPGSSELKIYINQAIIFRKPAYRISWNKGLYAWQPVALETDIFCHIHHILIYSSSQLLDLEEANILMVKLLYFSCWSKTLWSDACRLYGLSKSLFWMVLEFLFSFHFSGTLLPRVTFSDISWNLIPNKNLIFHSRTPQILMLSKATFPPVYLTLKSPCCASPI